VVIAARIGEQTLKGKIRCLAIDPTDPAKMFAGTEPAALFVSTDEGRSWKEAAGVREIARHRQWTYPVPSIEPHIRWIALDGAKQRILLAAQVGGIVYSGDNGASWHDLRDPIDMDVHSIQIDRKNPQSVFAATGGGERNPYPKGKPLYRSDDGGRSWTSISDAWSVTTPFRSNSIRQTRALFILAARGARHSTGAIVLPSQMAP
jgi:photosystem II stability/assembly factor-like uncharacterized protein